MRGIFKHRAAVAALMLLACSAQAGQPQPDARPPVGRVERGDGQYCIGTLVGRDRVLTSAACLHDAAGRRIDPNELTFRVAGHDAVAGRRAVIHPDFEFIRGMTIDRLRSDAALLQLERPVPEVPVRPVRAVPPETTLQIAPRASDAAPDRCIVRDHVPGAYALACDGMARMAGTPMLRRQSGGWHIVAMVAGAGHSADGIVFGTEAGAALAELRAALRVEKGVQVAATAAE